MVRIEDSGRWLRTAGLAAAWAVLVPFESPAGIVVRAERAAYLVTDEGSAAVTVLIDGDDAAPGIQPVAGSLFSGGVRLRFASDRVDADDSGIAVVPALDFSGFAPGAERSAGIGNAAFKGNIDLARDPLAPYPGGALATFLLRFPPGERTVVVTPELPRDSVNETIFVDGAGTAIDSLIRFEPFTIVPPPGLAIELVPGGARSVRLSFSPAAGFRHVVEASDRLDGGPGDWIPLPGAPHDTGLVLDPVTRPARFYRLVVVAE